MPNGTLFADGVAAKIKEKLLTEFNLHTIVRLPNGVFAPYTSIPTNVLFFDTSGPTMDIWYYEQPQPEGRKNYTKTAPIQFEEFALLKEWWSQRAEGEQAWKVDFKAKSDAAKAQAEPHWQAARNAEGEAQRLGEELKVLAEQIALAQKRGGGLLEHSMPRTLNELQSRRAAALAEQRTATERAKAEKEAGDALYWPIFNLDSKNPTAAEDFTHLPPEQLVEDIIAKERRIFELMVEIQQALGTGEIK